MLTYDLKCQLGTSSPNPIECDCVIRHLLTFMENSHK